MQCGGIKNGALLKLIEREGIDVFLTANKNMEQQQTLEGLAFAILVLSAIHSPVIRPYVLKVAPAVGEARPGTIKHIECGVFIPRSKSAGD